MDVRADAAVTRAGFRVVGIPILLFNRKDVHVSTVVKVRGTGGSAPPPLLPFEPPAIV